MATTFAQFKAANPGYVGRSNPSMPSAPSGPKKQTGKGGTATSMISEGSSILGGILGSFIPVPVVGTAVGAGIGGFLGRLAENKIRDNEYHLAEAGKEGALSAAFGLIPGGQAAKGGYRALGKQAAKAGAKALGKDVAQETIETVASKNVGKLAKAGGAMRGVVRGIRPGVNGITTAESIAQNAAADNANKWFKGITRSSQFTNLEDKLTKLADKYAKSAEAKKVFTGDSAMDVLSRFQQNVTDNPSIGGKLTGQAKRVYDNLIDDVTKLENKTNKDFIDMASGKINPRYKKISSGGNLGSQESQIYEAMRDAMKGHIDEKMLTRSSINREISAALGAKKNISKAITADTGSGIVRGMSPSRVLGDIGNIGLDVTGRGLQQMGRVTNSTAARQATRQLGGRMITGSTGSTSDQSNSTSDQDFTQAMTELGLGDMNGVQDMTQQQPQQELYPAQNMLQDIQRDFATTGGKNVDKYLSLYKALAAVSGGGSQSLNVTKPTSEKYSNAQSGLRSLNQYEQLLQQDPNLLTKSATPGRSLPVVGGYIANATGTGETDALAYDMMDNLLRIRTGAQANPAEIKNYVTKMLPRAGDSPQTVQRKLLVFRNAFGDILDLAGNGGQQSSQLQDAILNSGGAY